MAPPSLGRAEGKERMAAGNVISKVVVVGCVHAPACLCSSVALRGASFGQGAPQVHGGCVHHRVCVNKDAPVTSAGKPRAHSDVSQYVGWLVALMPNGVAAIASRMLPHTQHMKLRGSNDSTSSFVHQGSNAALCVSTINSRIIIIIIAPAAGRNEASVKHATVET